MSITLHYYWDESAVLLLEHTVWGGNLQACNYSSDDSGEDDDGEESEEMEKP